MSTIKKVWITKHDGDLVSLCFESEIVTPAFMRLKFEHRTFPDNPSVKNPLRHTGSVKLLSIDDLELIAETIQAYLDRD